MAVQWKPIKNYEGRYKISDCGDVKSLLRDGKLLKPAHDTKKYFIVGLLGEKKRKTVKIHHLVWDNFNGTCRKGLVIDHIDGNKENNKIDNLQLLTSGDNVAKGHQMRGRELPTGVNKVGMKYRAKIAHNYIKKHLGYYLTPEQASFAYQKARSEIYG